MRTILIRYKDFSSAVTERKISDIQPDPEGAIAINAYCHLRDARRSFKMDRIVHAIDPDTGELINPWKLLSPVPTNNGRELLDSITWFVLPGIKALKFFSLSTRGFRLRERTKVVKFIQEVAHVTDYSEDEVGEWVYRLWCADVYAYLDGDSTEYLELLLSIPTTLLARCRDYALLIARGSGRKPLNADWAARIDAEFQQYPQVICPKSDP